MSPRFKLLEHSLIRMQLEVSLFKKFLLMKTELVLLDPQVQNQLSPWWVQLTLSTSVGNKLILICPSKMLEKTQLATQNLKNHWFQTEVSDQEAGNICSSNFNKLLVPVIYIQARWLYLFKSKRRQLRPRKSWWTRLIWRWAAKMAVKSVHIWYRRAVNRKKNQALFHPTTMETALMLVALV